MTRHMTRTTAWRKVAEAFGTPEAQRSHAMRELTMHGLCWAITEVLQQEGGEIYDAMNTLGAEWGYWWPFGEEYARERATFAWLMAAMTQRERDQLVPGL